MIKARPAGKAPPSSVASVHEAAICFHRSTSQIRRWIADGAPVVRRGRGAKGHGALVNLAEIERWYHQRRRLKSAAERPAHEVFAQLGQWFLDAVKRGSSPTGAPIHEILSFQQRTAARYLVLVYKYLFKRQFGRDPFDRELPPPILQLVEIARTHAYDDSVPLVNHI